MMREFFAPKQESMQVDSQWSTATLAEIYDTYSPGLYRYSIRLLGDRDLAEDCVAETFSRLLQSLQSHNGPHHHLQAYLYRIAHNWIVDLFRRHEQTFELNDALPCDELPEEEAVRQIRQKQVRKAIRRLTPDQQQVIILKYLECWSNEDIARVLCKPVGAVKSIQHRALVSLHTFLGEL
jgi:RNA polymerase sigma-70 factor (ECF subfamily)